MTPPARRFCQIIKLRPEAEAEYKKIHANVWPGVLAALERHNIADYSIHYHPPLNLLIATFKYVGSNYEADMKGIAADPETLRWWAVTDGMQESLVEGATGSAGTTPWWQQLEEVFRFEGKTVS
ncbi:rhamnose mutarotase [Epithele typhae]|uniref:rhamnose mutarotase n=1 Tax=Epithele typhae TaxID=378194 RepID=UPI0020083DB3|nr:rhamnose mutarotase [Epithele typhae]KAH9918389.1 rhamnose mutarotase [Epithele typhae]